MDRRLQLHPRDRDHTTEMWQKETFDPAIMEREMGAAGTLGFNSARVFVQYLVWESDPQGLKARMDQLLQISSRHGIRIMFVCSMMWSWAATSTRFWESNLR